jgi:hypothetical protein
MPKMTKTQLKATGRAIMAKAKAIRKAKPSKKWRDCVSEAAKTIKKK